MSKLTEETPNLKQQYMNKISQTISKNGDFKTYFMPWNLSSLEDRIQTIQTS